MATGTVTRPDQRAPDGDWLTWLILAGRGWGKNMRRLEELAHLRELRENEVIVPVAEEEKVVNMNRQQRRAWGRRQQKAKQGSKS